MSTARSAAVAFLGSAFLTAVIIGGGQAGHEPISQARETPKPEVVRAGGVTLTSTSIDLPDDGAPYTGARAEVMNGNCTACHSASMALNQPKLTAAEWTDEVSKMRETYKAKVDDAAVPEIVDYLTRMSDALPADGKAAHVLAKSAEDRPHAEPGSASG